MKKIIYLLFLGLVLNACTSTLEQRTNRAIQEVMDEYNAVGMAAVVVKDGQVIYDNAFGYKDLYQQIPLTTSHLMRIASISKSFTATGLLQLMEQGRLSLDDDISDLIGFQIRNPHHPDVPITLRMVLSHTASFRDKEDYSTLDHINPAVYGDCAESYFDYAPGQGYNYSNLGLNLAGTILEKVSGVRFDQYIMTHVMAPLGLHASHNVDLLDTARIAKIYHLDGDNYVESRAYVSVAHRLEDYTMGYSAPIFSPTGGVKICPRDLATYMMMHMNYGELNGVRLISEASSRLMQTPVWIAQNKNEERYGLCLWEFENFIHDDKYNRHGHLLVGHTGDAYGLRSLMLWSPEDNWGIVAMTNGYTINPDLDIVEAMGNAIYDACLR